MEFNHFLKNINFVSSTVIPGVTSHLKMAPQERTTTHKNCSRDAKKAAVMMLLYPKNEVAHIVLIIRNTYAGVHSAQIAFPGGKVEASDESIESAALRETYEEVGISSSQISIIRSFSDIYIPPSNFIVYPFLGVCDREVQFTLQYEEVAGIIEIPLSSLIDDSFVTSEIINTSYAENISVPVFNFDGNIIWGATAMMLSELKDVLKMVF